MQNSWMETHIVAPIPGKDYPQNWNDFLDWFATRKLASSVSGGRSHASRPNDTAHQARRAT